MAKKTQAKKKTVAKAPRSRAAPRKRKPASRSRKRRQPGVRVRMYRHGLGDCFLLSLPSDGERPFFLMIDCGVILGTRDPKERMEEVVADIVAATGGYVDLLVVTHEHWDHLSGFLQAQDLFAAGDEAPKAGKLGVRSLWLAWTEDPRDDLAALLRGERRKLERGLRLSLNSLRAAEVDARPAADAGADSDDPLRPWSASAQVESLLDFFGARSGGTSDALEAAQGYSQTPPRYCRPDDPPLELPQVPGVRFYVLGPPRDEKLIKKSHPSRSHSEVYEAAPGMSPESAFFGAALDRFSAAEGEFSGLREASLPFDRRYRIPERQAAQMPFFQRHYWGDAQEGDYADQSWRQIDGEWLAAATELALKLDNDTNNTSLALAIELTASGRVLLFPGDAQVGNWLSWENLSWTVDGDRKVSGHDLLERTVLYKVGHHGSHNATLREKGLELMRHPDLVAMVPVDHEMAKKKRWFKIPFAPLLERLEEKTNGRVLRADRAEPVADQAPPRGVRPADWRRYQKRVEETRLFLEYRIDL